MRQRGMPGTGKTGQQQKQNTKFLEQSGNDLRNSKIPDEARSVGDGHVTLPPPVIGIGAITIRSNKSIAM